MLPLNDPHLANSATLRDTVIHYRCIASSFSQVPPVWPVGNDCQAYRIQYARMPPAANEQDAASIPSHSIYNHHRLNPLPSIQGFQRKNHIGIFLPRVFLGGGRVRAAFGPCGFTPEGPQENMNRDDLWGTVMNCELVNLSKLYQIIHNIYIYIYIIYTYVIYIYIYSISAA